MPHLILAVITWACVIVLIPGRRIKELIPAAIIGFFWKLVVDIFSISQGYYSYDKMLLPISGAPFFGAVAAAGGGILVLNWLSHNPWSRLFVVIIASAAMSVFEIIFLQLGAFNYGRFDTIISYLQSVAVFSVYIWICLGIIGEERIYSGNKSRFGEKHLMR